METQAAETVPELLIGITTVESGEDANALARKSVESGLVVCAQVEEPIHAYYIWKGKMETAVEYRITLKFLASRHSEVETWLSTAHPYDVPEWIVFSPTKISEKYLRWAKKTSNGSSF